mgnify:FL=1
MEKLKLPIKLTHQAPIPLYQQLASQLRALIKQQYWQIDERLPAIRQLADDLKINPVTVISAYRSLMMTGEVISRRGSGYYVHQLPQGIVEANQHRGEEHHQLPTAERMIDFASYSLHPERVAVAEIKQAVDHVLADAGGEAFTVNDPMGLFNLSHNQIVTSSDQIQITSGSQQAIDLCARTLLHPGDIVLMQNPSYSGAIDAFRASGAHIIGISPEPSEEFIATLEAKIKLLQPKLLYLMSNVANPTGLSLTDQQKHQVYGLAHHYDLWIIEDDYGVDVSGDWQPTTIKMFDRDERVIYLRSLSRVLAAGIRLGYMVLPQGMVERIVNAKQIADLSTSGLAQRIFEQCLTSQSWQQYLHRSQMVYQRQYWFVNQLLKESQLPITWQAVDHCSWFWLKLPVGRSAKDVCQQAQQAGVLVENGDRYFVDQQPDQYLRLSLAPAKDSLIQVGLERLIEIISRLD